MADRKGSRRGRGSGSGSGGRRAAAAATGKKKARSAPAKKAGAGSRGSGGKSAAASAPPAKLLVVKPSVPRARTAEFLARAEAAGARAAAVDPSSLPGGSSLLTLHGSAGADYVLLGAGGPGGEAPGGGGKRRGSARGKRAGGRIGRRFTVSSNRDIDAAVAEAEKGLDFVVVEARDWKIIPLENIVARLHRARAAVFTTARTPADVRKAFSILDVGLDGVVFTTSSVADVQSALSYMGSRSFALSEATITEVGEAGDGERVCVDTASMLGAGEGMLVGSRSNFYFLVHNESIASSFTAARPFRVNAGAVHAYTPGADGRTRYLSEVEGGTEVLVVDSSGAARRATVGRAKIERRPMLMVKASAGGEVGGIIIQDAETVRLVRPGGRAVSVTDLRAGDRVMVHTRPAAGRHFGTEVAGEYILEK